MLTGSATVKVLLLGFFPLFYEADSACINGSRIICPCGSTGTFFSSECNQQLISETDPCDSFKFCETCVDGKSRCQTCPKGYLGPFCTESALTETRSNADFELTNITQDNQGWHKRRVRDTNCPDLLAPKVGSMRCTFSRYDKKCTGRCLPGHHFKDIEAEEIVLTCDKGRWQSRSSFPACISDGSCDVEMAGPGYYNCTTGPQGTRCDVQCTGTNSMYAVRGRYSCYPGRSWQPPLPYCLKKKAIYPERRECNCQNGGTCDYSTGTCQCPENYQGRYCQEHTYPERHSCYCTNGGECNHSTGKCECPSNYGGPHCENPIYPIYPIKRTCPGPQTFPNGDITDVKGQTVSTSGSGPSFDEGATIFYYCWDGFALIGTTFRTCGASGSWLQPQPTCQRIVTTTTTTTTTTARPVVRKATCSDPGFVKDGQRWTTDGKPSQEIKTFQEGESAIYSCRSGFALEGLSLLACLPSGRWSNSLPKCKQIAQPTITTTTTTTTTEKPDRISYCDYPGTIRNGERIIHTGLDARTSRSSANNRQRFPSGIRLEYKCKDGYLLQGEKEMICLRNGKWSARTPTCEPRTDLISYCDDPGVIRNGERIIDPGLDARTSANNRDRFPSGMKMEYKCKHGYLLQGAKEIVCLRSGQWSARTPSCEGEPRTGSIGLKYCPNPGAISNGARVVVYPLTERRKSPNLDDPEYPEGVKIEYSCEFEFRLIGKAVITCMSTSSWNGNPPECRTVSEEPVPEDMPYCPDPGHIADGKRVVVFPLNERGNSGNKDAEEYPAGVKIQYTCEEGFDLVGKSSITCLDTGSWNSDIPDCLPGCGIAPAGDTRRVVRGERTTAGQWPWQVGIAEKKKTNPKIDCGGVLINRRSVVTAAHCVSGRRLDKTILYFGKHFFSTRKDDNKVVTRQPTSFKIHPKYNSNTLDADIAVIRFAPDVKFTTRIHPICLPTSSTTKKNLAQGSKGIVTGWGLTENNVNPDVLMMAEIPVVSTSACKKAYKEQKLEFPITDNMFCAGYQEGRVDSCTGDSGGPLSFYDSISKRYVVEGLVSFGVQGGCARPNRYTVYTKVGNLVRWVKENI